MYHRRLALLIIAALLLSAVWAAPAVAKPGGGKPPPTEPPPLTNPAFVYVAEDNTTPNPYHQLYVTNVDGSVTEQLTFDAYKKIIPEWSPDGTRVAYVRNQDGQVQPWCGGIYARTADGTGDEELLFDLCEEPYSLYLWSTPSRLSWSPDNRMLIGAQGPVSLDPGIYEIDLATGAVSNIVPSLTPGLLDRAIHAAWSPDLDDSTEGYQGEIAVCGGVYDPTWHATGIYILDPDTGALKREIPGTAGYGCDEGSTEIDWSPDGQWLVYNVLYTTDQVAARLLLKSRTDATGGPILLAECPVDPHARWSPDSALISLLSTFTVRKKTQWDLFYTIADGSGPTNVTHTARREFDQDWNPAWQSDL